jgi:signal transduction histidine kinase
VLLNLVGNAIKFTDSGEVRVTAKAVNGQFAVSVMDTGAGHLPEQALFLGPDALAAPANG